MCGRWRIPTRWVASNYCTPSLSPHLEEYLAIVGYKDTWDNRTEPPLANVVAMNAVTPWTKIIPTQWYQANVTKAFALKLDPRVPYEVKSQSWFAMHLYNLNGEGGKYSRVVHEGRRVNKN